MTTDTRGTAGAPLVTARPFTAPSSATRRNDTGGRVVNQARGQAQPARLPCPVARKEAPVAAHDAEGGRYHKDVFALDADHPWHRLRELVPPGTTVLDVGCGSG